VTSVGVVADLAFTVTIPDGATSASVSGRVRGEGSRLVISTGDAYGLLRAANLGGSGPLAAVRSVRRCADLLASEGLSVSLAGTRGTLVELGKSDAEDGQGAPARRRSIRPGRVRDGYPWFVLRSALIMTARRFRRR
jgi:hypothetical protein